MKFKIHFVVNDYEDSIVIIGDTPKEVREKFDDYTKDKDVSDYWSEFIED